MNPFPTPVRRTPDSAEYFDFADRGQVLLRRCSVCSAMRGPQEQFCPACHAIEYEAVSAGGRGRLVTWCVVHRSPVPGLPTPYVAALVECDEGPWIFARLLDAEDTALQAGAGIELVTVPTGDGGESIVAARPALVPDHRAQESGRP